MKKIRLFVEGISFTYNKYSIVDENAFNNLIATHDNVVCDENQMIKSGIIKYESKETLTFVYEEELCYRGFMENYNADIINTDEVYIESLQVYDVEEGEPEFDDIDCKYSDIVKYMKNMLSPNGEKCLYYPHSIDFYYEDEDEFFEYNRHYQPYLKYIAIDFEIEDDEEFDVNKVKLLNRYCSYETPTDKNKVNISNTYVPICDDYYMFKGDIPDIALLMTNKIVYNNKVIDAVNETDSEDFILLRGYRPFIINKDTDHITMI